MKATQEVKLVAILREFIARGGISCVAYCAQEQGIAADLELIRKAQEHRYLRPTDKLGEFAITKLGRALVAEQARPARGRLREKKKAERKGASP